METIRFEKATSQYKIHGLPDEVLDDIVLRNLAAITEFLFYVEAEPFVMPEKAEDQNLWLLERLKPNE